MNDTRSADVPSRVLTSTLALAWIAIGIAACPVHRAAASEPEVINTQAPGDAPPTPLESLAKVEVPPGFSVTLFAGEPDVRQPIAMDIDDRGRLWVIECYSYTDGHFLDQPRDRVLIFTDDDQDGRFDRRQVFWDQGQRLTGLALGFGGVWLTAAPNLLFLPDTDRDDRPDGPPMVMLDGFEAERAGHNIVNGLRWGPDGWLYGRHGILSTSLVGRPGTAAEQRIAINCGIWRFHPIRHVFEVVVHGTTNPWGMDFDDLGNLFFTNNVIGHLFHAIPGAHYERMYGSDLNPFVYELMPMCADHYHWDTGVAWQETREGINAHPELGGGHSHCGAMIYLGDNWPAQYRNRIFMCNTHGKRVNSDVLHPHGSGYVATHGEDFLTVHDSWFRGLELIYGPDGGVYLSDWSDLGECHDHDGVHRTSGRIYKVVYDKAATNPRSNRGSEGIAQLDLQSESSEALVELQAHANEWYVRQARRILHERAARGELPSGLVDNVRQKLQSERTARMQLRWLWLLYVTGGADEPTLANCLQGQPHLRRWAVRLLADTPRWPETARQIATDSVTAEQDPSVCMEWASALRRMDHATRASVAMQLVQKKSLVGDENLSHMIWYGIEPLVAADAQAAVSLLEASRLPTVRRLIARRVTEQIEDHPETVNTLVKKLSQADAERRLDTLQGMQQALRGRRQVTAPAAWRATEQVLRATDNQAVRDLTRDLSVLFGSGVALETVRAVALDQALPTDERRQALQSVIAAAPPSFAPVLQRLLNDRAVEDLAAKGLAEYDHPATAEKLLEAYEHLDQPARRFAIATLTSRTEYARELLYAVADGRVSRDDITPTDARQMSNLNDAQVQELLEAHWGSIRSTPADRQQQMEALRKLIESDQSNTADPRRGRVVFDRACASCHKLFGQGQLIGPDLTGSNRSNLDFLLGNIVDPSAMVATDYRMSVVELEDGRILNGVVSSETEERITLQTATELRTVDRNTIVSIDPTQLSLMPDGLLQEMSQQEILDLFHYLASPQQVPPAASDDL